VDAGEWAFWQRVWREMPFGPPAEDERHAVLSARIYGAMGSERTLDEMRLDWTGRGREPVIIDTRAGVKALAAALGGR